MQMQAEGKAARRSKQRDGEAEHDGHRRITQTLTSRRDRTPAHQRRVKSNVSGGRLDKRAANCLTVTAAPVTRVRAEHPLSIASSETLMELCDKYSWIHKQMWEHLLSRQYVGMETFPSTCFLALLSAWRQIDCCYVGKRTSWQPMQAVDRFILLDRTRHQPLFITSVEICYITVSAVPLCRSFPTCATLTNRQLLLLIPLFTAMSLCKHTRRIVTPQN